MDLGLQATPVHLFSLESCFYSPRNWSKKRWGYLRSDDLLFSPGRAIMAWKSNLYLALPERIHLLINMFFGQQWNDWPNYDVNWHWWYKGILKLDSDQLQQNGDHIENKNRNSSGSSLQRCRGSHLCSFLISTSFFLTMWIRVTGHFSAIDALGPLKKNYGILLRKLFQCIKYII